jgi:hypothetical protein
LPLHLVSQKASHMILVKIWNRWAANLKSLLTFTYTMGYYKGAAMIDAIVDAFRNMPLTYLNLEFDEEEIPELKDAGLFSGHKNKNIDILFKLLHLDDAEISFSIRKRRNALIKEARDNLSVKISNRQIKRLFSNRSKTKIAIPRETMNIVQAYLNLLNKHKFDRSVFKTMNDQISDKKLQGVEFIQYMLDCFYTAYSQAEPTDFDNHPKQQEVYMYLSNSKTKLCKLLGDENRVGDVIRKIENEGVYA